MYYEKIKSLSYKFEIMKKLFFAALACFSITVSWVSLCAMSAPDCCKPTQIDTLTIAGAPFLSSDMKVTVALPSKYFEENDATEYPVIYLLNGHGGDYRNWPRVIPIDSVADLYEAIIICPSGMNSWYWDAPEDPGMQMESFFIQKLIPTVDSLYRTRTDRMGRAITGMSMGGHGGLWLGIRHSDLFGSAGSTCGGVNIMPFPKNWSMSKWLGEQSENKEQWQKHTVMSLVDSLKPGQLNIFFDCGTEDFFYDVNCALDSALNSRRIYHIYKIGPGAHEREYWSKSIFPQLEYFSKIFKSEN